MDGLGRLTQVTENGISASTSYSYDALDNLTAVTPPGGFAGRSFVNSSLKRLISATNPETGPGTPITYTYDANGNLKTKTAGGVTTTFTYDPLDELTGKTYSDSTPAASYTYSAGWRSAASSGGTAYTYLFDGLGRATTATQTTSGTPYQFTYLYNLVDEITKMTMPSGTVIMNGYDLMGRPVSVTGQAISASSATAYASSVARTPAGAIQQMTLGNGFTEETCYNNMQQPFVIRQRRALATSCQTGTASDSYDVGYFAFTFPATTNNGNIAGQTIQYAASGSYSPMTFQQSYGYDGVNSLSNVTETGGGPTWSQSFGYDAVGNRWLSGGAQIDPTTPITDVFNSNNQINATGYDAKGNQQTNGGYTFTYDAENRLITTNMFGTTYGYDADGRRVTKTSSGLITTYVYDVTGQLAAQYGGPASCPLTCYLMTDHLGSTRMQTDSGGNQLTLYDYAPFGEELAGLDGRDARWGGFGGGIHFTGKEQEGYEGAYLHYFGARYFSGGLGRWTSPDPSNLGIDFWLPQTWNRYAFVGNNPLRFVDRTGLWPTSIHELNVDESLPGLSPQQRQLLKDASYAVDHSMKYLGVFDSQSAEASPMHSMSNGNDPDEAHAVGLAITLSDRFIQENEAEARVAQAKWVASGNSGISPQALLAFGNALHTIQDSTSPAHAGFQPWSGCWLPLCANGARHVWRERPSVYNAMRGQVVQATRNAYLNTFGALELLAAIDGLQPEVTSTIKYDVPNDQEP